MSSICNICKQKLEFDLGPKFKSSEIDEFREALKCRKCKSISRDRLLMWVFSNCVSEQDFLSDVSTNKNLRIFESTGLRGYGKSLKLKFDYVNTRFENILKHLFHSRKITFKFANLENLPFEDESFDYVLSGDVLEHVRYDEKAFTEIYRVLRKNGYFLLTVPFDYSMEKTLVKVESRENKDYFIMPPEYHGGKSLVFRIYGRDLFKKLNSIGFKVSFIEIHIPKFAISKQEIFVCRKNHEPKTAFINNYMKMVLNKKDFF